MVTPRYAQEPRENQVVLYIIAEFEKMGLYFSEGRLRAAAKADVKQMLADGKRPTRREIDRVMTLIEQHGFSWVGEAKNFDKMATHPEFGEYIGVPTHCTAISGPLTLQ